MKPRPNKSKAGGKGAGKENRAPPPARQPPMAPPVPQSSGRRWLFRIVAMVVLPVVLLGGLEAGLRLGGYGYDTGFVRAVHLGGQKYLVNNEDFSRRFFPPQLARWPGPVMMAAKKPANTYRIFILGESAARGEPEPNYAASRYLQALLAERYPATQFEVVNLGITAINSHVILPIARDCARAGGDLWIIYMGNNEMVGPFGAATVFGQKAPPLAFVRLNLAVQQTHVGQLLVDLGRRLGGRQANTAWGGMKMFLGNQIRADDPRKTVVYQNFERNLNDIIHAGLNSGAKVLLNTVAVNLRDCPPFASLVNSNLPAATRAQFEQVYARACTAQAQTNYAAAAQSFSQAAALDDLHPGVQYRWGECLLGLTNAAAARGHFQQACDADALPFRADARINQAIQQAGQSHVGSQLTFLDAAAALALQAPDSLCGAETFYEHVHFNFDGNFRLGRLWAEQVEKMLPVDITRGAVTNGWASQAACERWLGLTDWNRVAVAEMVMDRLHHAPLSGQANNAERLLALQTEVAQLRRQMNPETAGKAAALYQEAIGRSPQDHLLAENYAEFLAANGDLKGAAAQWQRVCVLLPEDCAAYYQAGRLLSALDQWPEAETALTRAVTLRPRLTEGWFELGTVHLGAGQFDQALAAYERAADLEPANAVYRSYIGKALSKLNRHTEAIEQYRRALQMDPDLWETHFALGDELVAVNQISDAGGEYAEVIRLKPGNALAHLDLGVMAARQGRMGEALQEFETTLRLDPANAQAREYMARVQDWQKQRH